MILTNSFDTSNADTKINTIKAMVLRSISDVHPEIRILSKLLYPNESKLTKDLNGYWDYYACQNYFA